MDNARIADTFDHIADLLEFTGANPFRVRAYRNGARTIRDLSEPAAAILADENRSLTDIDGIGKDLADKIAALVAGEKLPLLEELTAQVPESVLALMRIPGVGPKKAAALYKELGVKTLDELRAACEAGKVRGLKGFGAKTEQAILAGLSVAEQSTVRMLWADADIEAQRVLAHLRGAQGVKQLEMAGSYRRGRDTVGDLDVLAVADDPEALMDRFATIADLETVIGRGDTKMSVRLSTGVQIDLRVVPPQSFGAALVYFTGSKDHNIVLRSLAKKEGLKINEYGVFRGEKYVAGRTEKEVYDTLGLPVFPPELREARREFDWAAAGALPVLVEERDIQGDLHMHTHATDGRASIEDMVAAAKKRGLKYIAITDHSKRVSMANGLDAKRALAQWKQIDRLNAEADDGFLVLKGIECDILERGGMDLPDDVLAQADWVVASVHYGQNQPRAQITERILGALEDPHVHAIAHPTGRLLNRRMAYEVDLEAVYAAARKHHKLLELNANPKRLDLDDTACAAAKERGIPIVINTDAHSTEGLGVMRYGILQARRAGLTQHDVANARPWAKLKKLLHK
ncbi:MAG: DNA polymerase/3'-5' exonuclease PolX [Planctomycetota bacterium]|nr:MAG: DNA polymerase/3'-5' exonuclease PolX [Planctomycetota bacterium]